MSEYTVYVTAAAWLEIKELPGNVRQRVKRAIDELVDSPRAAKSKKLDTPEFDRDLYRLRLDNWRVVYAVTESERIIDVLAIRKRPPYDYGDLRRLLEEAGGR